MTTDTITYEPLSSASSNEPKFIESVKPIKPKKKKLEYVPESRNSPRDDAVSYVPSPKPNSDSNDTEPNVDENNEEFNFDLLVEDCKITDNVKPVVPVDHKEEIPTYVPTKIARKNSSSKVSDGAEETKNEELPITNGNHSKKTEKIDPDSNKQRSSTSSSSKNSEKRSHSSSSKSISRSHSNSSSKSSSETRHTSSTKDDKQQKLESTSEKLSTKSSKTSSSKSSSSSSRHSSSSGHRSSSKSHSKDKEKSKNTHSSSSSKHHNPNKDKIISHDKTKTSKDSTSKEKKDKESKHHKSASSKNDKEKTSTTKPPKQTQTSNPIGLLDDMIPSPSSVFDTDSEEDDVEAQCRLIFDEFQQSDTITSNDSALKRKKTAADDNTDPSDNKYDDAAKKKRVAYDKAEEIRGPALKEKLPIKTNHMSNAMQAIYRRQEIVRKQMEQQKREKAEADAQKQAAMEIKSAALKAATAAALHLPRSLAARKLLAATTRTSTITTTTTRTIAKSHSIISPVSPNLLAIQRAKDRIALLNNKRPTLTLPRSAPKLGHISEAKGRVAHANKSIAEV